MICNDLGKAFGDKVLFSHLSFSINTGILLIKGNSGTGKTTLINILMGLEKQDSGDFSISKNIAYCGSKHLLFLKRSLNDNLKIFLNSYDEELKRNLLASLNMIGLEDKPLVTLSLGQIAKAKIIFTFLKKADVYFLDEVFASLDSQSKSNLCPYLNTLAKNSLVVLITHLDVDSKIGINLIVNLDNNSIQVIKDENNLRIQNPSNCKQRINPLHFAPSKIKLSVLSFICLFLTFIFFSLGTAFYNFNSTSESLKISLENDPFKYHRLQVTKKIDMNELSKNYMETLTLNSKTEKVLVISSNEIPSNSLRYYDLLNSNGFKNREEIKIDQNTYTIDRITKNITKEDFPDSMEIASMFDGFMPQQNILVVNKPFFKTLLLKGPSILNKDFETNLGMSFKDGILQNQSTVYPTVVDDKINFVSIPNVREGTEVSFSPAQSFSYLTSKEEASNKIIVSYDVFYNFYLYFARNDGILLSNNQILEDSYIKDNFIVSNIIYDYSSNLKTYAILSFISSLVFFILLIVLIILSKEHIKNIFNTDKEIIETNFLQNKIKENIFLQAFTLPLLSLIITLILYFSSFLRIANLLSVTLAYPNKDISSFYYYSMQPLNSYYDHLVSPLPFLHYNNLILLSILIMVVAGISVAFLIKKEMTSKK